MATIASIIAANLANIRNKILAGSVTRPAVADGIDAVAYEVRDRGVIVVSDLVELQAQSGANTRKVVVRNGNLYEWLVAGVPDGSSILPASGGGVWSLVNLRSDNGAIDTKNADYLLKSTDGTILVNTAGGNVTVAVNPTLTRNIQRIKKISADANKVFIVPTVGTIDGAASKEIEYQNENLTIQSNGANVYLLS